MCPEPSRWGARSMKGMPVGLFGKKDDAVAESPKTLDEGGVASKTANAIVQKLMDFGFDGLGPLDSVEDVVKEFTAKYPDPEKAITKIIRSHTRLVASGGFVTGFGGLFTLPVAIPANIIEFYVLATRMVGSIAEIRGYDVRRPEVRTAVLLTLVGADSTELLNKAGVPTGTRLAQIAAKQLPEAAMMVINKGVGFRVATKFGGQTLSRFTKGVPIAGGVIGAGLDTFMLDKIADNAKVEFPAQRRLTAVPAQD